MKTYPTREINEPHFTCLLHVPKILTLVFADQLDLDSDMELRYC
jgi:hypothetical protein